jgi:hypothetical protein
MDMDSEKEWLKDCVCTVQENKAHWQDIAALVLVKVGMDGTFFNCVA